VTSDNDFFRDCYGTLWNFTFGGKVPELYGTFECVLWNGTTMKGSEQISQPVNRVTGTNIIIMDL